MCIYISCLMDSNCSRNMYIFRIHERVQLLLKGQLFNRHANHSHLMHS